MPALTGNQYAAGNAGGRPSKYNSDYAAQAYRLCLLGQTDAGLAFFFGVDERTINRWKKQYEEFSISVTRGKTIADAEVALSLYRMATGYTYRTEKLFHHRGLIIRASITVVVPPSVQAAMYWLRMRNPTKWGDRQIRNVDQLSHTRVSRSQAGDIIIQELRKPALSVR